MAQRISRAIQEPLRGEYLSWSERWKGPDKGLITCWEVGRKMAKQYPELAERAKNGELPEMGWKGGVVRKLKQEEKIGTHFYLAQWQGIRDDNLDIDPTADVVLICSRTGMKVVFTGDYSKYANA